MSSDGDKKKQETAAIPLLTYGATTNFFKWSAKIKPLIIAQFGRISAYVFDGKKVPYSIDQIDTSSWTQEQIQQLAVEAVKIRIKEHESMTLAVNRIFGIILSHISATSLERVSLETEWATAERDLNAKTLWTLIVRTHQVQRTGVTVIDHAQQSKRISDISQGRQETLTAFVERFHAVVRGFSELGMVAPPESFQAVRFVDALDDTRYLEFKNALRNNASMGIMAYPADLSTAVTAAMRFASGHTVTKHPKSESAFVVSTQEKNANNKKKSGKGKQEKQGKPTQAQPSPTQAPPQTSQPKQKNVVCKLCGQSGHYVVKCPRLTECAHSVQGGGGRHDREDVHATVEEDHTDIVLRTVHGARGTLGPNSVLLDNQATVSVFHNGDLLTNIRKGRSIKIRGIDDREGGGVVTNIVGTFGPFGDVHVSPHATANILSLSSLSDAMFTIEFVQGEKFSVTHKESGRVYDFFFEETNPNTKAGLFAMDAAHAYPDEAAMVATISDNSARFTKREVEAAKKARTLQERLCFPSSRTLIAMIQRGHVVHSDVTARDVVRADLIFGPSVGGVMGKTTDKKVKPAIIEHVVDRAVQVEQQLYADVVFLEGVPYVISLSEPLGLTILTDVQGSRKAEDLFRALDGQIRTYNARGFTIDTLHCDGEGGFAKHAGALEDRGIKINRAAPGKHVSRIERRIRTFKERLRAVMSTMPFKIPKILRPELYKYVVQRLNMHPHDARVDPTPPREIFYGRKLSAHTDLRLAFGDYCHISPDVGATKNSLDARTEGAIALYASGNQDGGCKFFKLSTQQIVTRHQFQKLPMPQHVIEHLNKMAADARTTPLVELGETLRQELDDRSDDQQDDHSGNEELDDLLPAFKLWKDPLPGAPLFSLPTQEIHPQADGGGRGDGAVEVRDDNPDEGGIDDADDATPEFGMHVTVSKAIELYKEDAVTAIVKELIQLMNKDVFSPVRRQEISRTGGKIIHSSVFLKEKLSADGQFEKLKARLVAGGNEQERVQGEDVSSPTLATTSLMMLAHAGSHRGLKVATMDIGGAYLNASRDGRKPVFVQLNQLITEILVALYPHLKGFVNEHGFLVMEAKKAIYGTVDAGKLWNAELTATLTKDLRLKQHPQDPCVLTGEIEGESCLLGLYVDDIILFYKSEKVLSKIHSTLVQKYGEASLNKGPIVNFLGMTMDFSEASGVKITMSRIVDEVLRHTNTTGHAATPASPELFMRDEESPKLDRDAKNEFHSVVAKLLYLAKRIRPDMLLAVNFLTTRVSDPTAEDEKKLERALKYLNATREMGLYIDTRRLECECYVDASFAVHPDCKGHSGAIITLGGGTIYAKSSKQRLVSKSSTESELIALSDNCSQIIWCRNFLLHLGFAMGPAIIFQDNRSTIRLAEAGRALSERTRHVDNRYFFIKDRIDMGHVAVRHLSTTEMLADLLTKPLQGEQFRRMRDSILRWKST